MIATNSQFELDDIETPISGRTSAIYSQTIGPAPNENPIINTKIAALL